jgi:ABC-2 type transport system ATP-binding protein
MIEIRGLTKRYGETTAVSDLSFDVMPGKVTGFLGPNGAGKTTTMRLILGLDYPNAGDIAFENGVRLHELTVVRASLEAAFMELTADSVEYRAAVEGAKSQPAGPEQPGQPPQQLAGHGRPGDDGRS